MHFKAQARWLQDATFGTLYRRNLLYNTCWEDPAVDHQAMALDSDSEVVVITSAGCNALDYALGDPLRPHTGSPRRVVAVDANPWQTAVLELKQAGIRALEHTDFFALFGYGHHPAARQLYARQLRSQLSKPSRRIWDEHIHWFVAGRRPGDTFYCHGLSGLVGRSVRAAVKRKPRLWRGLGALFDCRDLERQREIYEEVVEPLLFSVGLRWVLDRQLTMSLLGVPAEQTHAVKNGHGQGVSGFVRESLRKVLCDLPVQNNYFWALYLRGHYTPRNCPRYLTREGFARLKGGLVESIHPCTSTLTEALRSSAVHHPSHLVLLDHMDWMGKAQPQALAEEWQMILERARPGARLLWRSGGPSTSFVDDTKVSVSGSSIRLGERLRDHQAMANRLHRQDRVGTYASFRIVDLLS